MAPELLTPHHICTALLPLCLILWSRISNSVLLFTGGLDLKVRGCPWVMHSVSTKDQMQAKNVAYDDLWDGEVNKILVNHSPE